MHKIFNRNTVKVSCSCIENFSSLISSHNKKLIQNNGLNIKTCICRTKSTCLLDNQCQSQNIIYKWIVSTSVNPNKLYLKTAEGGFQKRNHNHTKCCRNKQYTKDTSLSKYIWEIKKKKKPKKSIFEMVNSEKGSCTIQHYKNVSFMSPRKTGNY